MSIKADWKCFMRKLQNVEHCPPMPLEALLRRSLVDRMRFTVAGRKLQFSVNLPFLIDAMFKSKHYNRKT